MQPLPADLHRRLGLTDDELARIVELLGRAPTELELAMYAVMWSEHCSYKSSKVHLRSLPTGAPWVVVGPGEGAGVIDVGGGLAVAVRIESHNHPSAVMPYQGAATGVGGIVRDVFSMGARPIAIMDPLRFGPLDVPRHRYLFEGVVAGISGYGNAVGVPTVGGDLGFDDCYSGNPLVNVLCLGVLPKDRLVLARAGAPGNLAVLLGASTGRDGIGGASVLASAGFDDASESKRPSVQVGDPFEEKKLIEACLALLDAGLAVGVQDLGAAGLSCAASETAAKTGVGMDVDIARVIRREVGMDAVEVMTSESQERMLAIVRPDDLDAVLALCTRHEIRAAVVGRVTDSGRFRVYDGTFDLWGVPGGSSGGSGASETDSGSDAAIADVPIGSLGDGPTYERPMARPGGQDALQADDPWPELERKVTTSPDLAGELLALLSTPTVGDSSWVWRQFDHQLFLGTVLGPGGDATVLRLKGTSKALALSVDGKARFCRLEPRTGGRLAVVEAARNVACAGAVPRALVNCLNFGNPEHPEVMWQFSEVVAGMSEACTALGIPVVGGNVSFYNESDGVDIDPTPVVGVVGVRDPLGDRVPPGPAFREGQRVVLLGSTSAELGGSEWAAAVHRLRGGSPPAVDLDEAGRLHELVRRLVVDELAAAVHDCSDGGLAVALAEMSILGEVGLDVDLGRAEDLSALHPAAALFSESTSRVVLGAEDADIDEMCRRAADAAIPVAVLGTVRGSSFRIGQGKIDVSVGDLAGAWRSAIPRHLEAGILASGG